MTTETKLPVHSASSLKVGSIIKLADREHKILMIAYYDDWIKFVFDSPWWDSSRETWRWLYGCNRGFCFEVIQL